MALACKISRTSESELGSEPDDDPLADSDTSASEYEPDWDGHIPSEELCSESENGNVIPNAVELNEGNDPVIPDVLERDEDEDERSH